MFPRRPSLYGSPQRPSAPTPLMNPRPHPWNSFLEALHSSLIDELVELHPEPKPELGLPKRLASFAPPWSGEYSGISAAVELDQKNGYAFLAADPEAERKLTIPLDALWGRVSSRARTEFSRRAITPGLRPPVPLDQPKYSASLIFSTCLIWIPFKLDQGRLSLGVGF